MKFLPFIIRMLVLGYAAVSIADAIHVTWRSLAMHAFFVVAVYVVAKLLFWIHCVIEHVMVKTDRPEE